MTLNRRTDLDFAPNLDFGDIMTNPILDIAARFWEDSRYEAFKICYRSMRRLDDLVDDNKSTLKGISTSDAKKLGMLISRWLSGVQSRDPGDTFQKTFLDILEKYKIPLWPWERLCKAMIYDLEYDGYRNLTGFLRYSEGAAIAPASVFMHLCGVKQRDNAYLPPVFDIRKAARPLALFSYLVHIMRDFQKDQLRNLNYFADNLILQFELTRLDLRGVAEGGAISNQFRQLMAKYVSMAEYYRRKARQTIDKTIPNLEPRYQLSLEIIYDLYLQIFEKIDPVSGNFTKGELLPSENEVKARIEMVLNRFEPVTP